MVPPLLVLALEFHQAPIRFGHLTDPTRPLPDAFGDWLVESSSALSRANIQGTAERLGTRPEALLDAFHFFLRQVLLTPRADHYRVLGLSRHSPMASVKRHHGLLVRFFHPDRRSGTDERSGLLTARINAAYQVLRDPDARGRYDQVLPRSEQASWGEADSDFFRPQAPLVPITGGVPISPTPLVPGRPLWLWALAGILLAVPVSLVILEPRQPLLRANPQLAQRAAPGPSYLLGVESPTDARGPGARPPAVRQPGATLDLSPDPGRLIGRLERSFAAGDLPELVSLYTANAVINQGAGPAGILEAFTDLDGQAEERRMSVVGLTWRTAPDQRLVGWGHLRVSTRSGSRADWRSAAGSLELELVPWEGDYRIAKMLYRLSPK
jgi:hypothetical protein